MKRPTWFVRPEAVDTRVVHSNAHVPKYGWKVQHLYTETEWIALRALQAAGKRESDSSWLVKDGSLSRIQKFTAKFTGNQKPLARATLSDALVRLVGKHILQRWDAMENRPMPRRTRGDGRWLTTWRILAWSDTLKAIAADAKLAHPGRRTFYVIGKGKRLVEVAEAVAWKLSAPAAEAAGPKAWAGTAQEFEEFKAEAAPAAAAGDAKRKPPEQGDSMQLVTQDVLNAARRNVMMAGVLPQRVQVFADACLAVAQKRGEQLGPPDLCAILDQSAMHFSKGKPRIFEAHIGVAAEQATLYLDNRAADAKRAETRQRQRTGTDDLVPAKDIPELWNE